MSLVGRSADASQFLPPSSAIVALQRRVGGDGGSQNLVTECVGTIVGGKHILTAAQCFLDPSVDYSQYFAQTITGPDSTTQQRDVKNIFLHPLFNQVDFHNDVAVLELNASFDMASVTAVEIDPNVNGSCFDDSLTATTWATDSVGGQAPVFNFSLTECVATEYCVDAIASDILVSDAVMFCSEHDLPAIAPSNSADRLDIGAPLFVYNDSDLWDMGAAGQWELYGMVSSRRYELANEGSHNGPQLLRVHSRTNQFHEFVADAMSGNMTGFPAGCIDCSGNPCGHYAGTLGDGICDDGTWGANFFCEAFDFDNSDCLDLAETPRCTDCDGLPLNCAPSNDSHSVLVVYETLLGNGICNVAAPNLNCSTFRNDNGDCDPIVNQTTSVGIDNSTGSCTACGPTKTECTQAKHWIGDGFCDSGVGPFGLDFNCSAFEFDGGDCKEATLTTTITATTAAPQLTSSSSSSSSTAQQQPLSTTAQQQPLSTQTTDLTESNLAAAEQQRVVVIASSVSAMVVVLLIVVIVVVVVVSKQRKRHANEEKQKPYRQKSHQVVAAPNSKHAPPPEFRDKGQGASSSRQSGKDNGRTEALDNRNAQQQ